MPFCFSFLFVCLLFLTPGEEHDHVFFFFLFFFHQVKKTITGRKKPDRVRLVEEDDDDDYGGANTYGTGYVDGEPGYGQDWSAKPTAKDGYVDPNAKQPGPPQQPGDKAASAEQKLRIKTGLKNDMVTDALKAPGSSASRVSGGPYHNNTGTAVPPGVCVCVCVY